jgi:phosphoribosylglycinamide formyltransferase-1
VAPLPNGGNQQGVALTARLVVLVSGSGTNLAALIDATRDPSYGARVVAVGSDRDDAEGVKRAERLGIPTFVVRVADFDDRDDWDEALTTAVEAHQPTLVVSAGFMKILGKRFLGCFTTVNTHPALLPAFPGAHAVRDALAYRVKITGATVHLVDAGVDTGPVIGQVAVTVEDNDDEASLHERIKVAERTMLVDAVGRMAREGWQINDRKVTIG